MSKRQSGQDRRPSLRSEIILVKNDIAWLKKFMFGFVMLIVLDIMINLLTLQPIAEKLFSDEVQKENTSSMCLVSEGRLNRR